MPRVAPRNAEEIAVGDILLMAGSDRVLRVTLIQVQGRRRLQDSSFICSANATAASPSWCASKAPPS